MSLVTDIEKVNQQYRWADEQGSEVFWHSVLLGHGLHVWYAEGKVKPATLLPLTAFRAVMVMQYVEGKDTKGKPAVQHQVHFLLQCDGRAMFSGPPHPWRISPEDDRAVSGPVADVLREHGLVPVSGRRAVKAEDVSADRPGGLRSGEVRSRKEVSPQRHRGDRELAVRRSCAEDRLLLAHFSVLYSLLVSLCLCGSLLQLAMKKRYRPVAAPAANGFDLCNAWACCGCGVSFGRVWAWSSSVWHLAYSSSVPCPRLSRCPRSTASPLVRSC